MGVQLQLATRVQLKPPDLAVARFQTVFDVGILGVDIRVQDARAFIPVEIDPDDRSLHPGVDDALFEQHPPFEQDNLPVALNPGTDMIGVK